MTLKDELTLLPMVEKLNWIHWAIQEGLNGNTLELERALVIVEDIREEYY